MIKFEDVFQSYNGRPGCMCGCNGTYSIPSHVTIEEANKEVGWNAYDHHSDRSVKLAVNKVNNNIDWNDPEDIKKHSHGDKCFFFDTNTRTTVVYLKK